MVKKIILAAALSCAAMATNKVIASDVDTSVSNSYPDRTLSKILTVHESVMKKLIKDQKMMRDNLLTLRRRVLVLEKRMLKAEAKNKILEEQGNDFQNKIKKNAKSNRALNMEKSSGKYDNAFKDYLNEKR